MKKVWVLLLLIVSTSVFAEWANVDDNDEMTTYVDFGTIKKKGNKVKMWHLTDFKTVQKVGNDRFLSMLSRDEYDCDEETSRMLDLYWYSGNMRNGDRVFSAPNIKDEPESISPGGVNKTLFEIACSNK